MKASKLIVASALILGSCFKQKPTCMEHKNDTLHKLSKSYIKHLIAQPYAIDVISIYIKRISDSDTFSVQINPNYPFLRHANYLGIDNVDGYKVVICGDTANPFVRINCPELTIPHDILEFNKAVDNRDNTNAYYYSVRTQPEFIGWKLYFNKGILLGNSNYHN